MLTRRHISFGLFALALSCGSSKSGGTEPVPAPTPVPSPAVPVPDPTPTPTPGPGPRPVPLPAPVPDPVPSPTPDPAPVPARDPIGEKAKYAVVKGQRTTPAIKSGQISLTVTQLSATAGSYDVKIDYDFMIDFIGRQQGSQVAPVPQEFFTQDFMAKLRSSGTFTSQGFTAKYLGTSDVTTASGTKFPACDKITITNLNQPLKVTDALERWDATAGDGEKMTMTLYVSPSVPVLGAVRVDIQTSIGASQIKVGGDYAP